MKDICGTTGLACTRCNPGACEHRRYSSGYHVIDKLNRYMIKQKLTIRGMAGEKLIIHHDILSCGITKKDYKKKES